MKIKPHIHNGRFYNHADDSILSRVKNTIKTIWLIALQRLSGKGNKKALVGKANLKSWSTIPTLSPRSDQLVITWLGHATFLIQVNGFNILTDPLFFELSRFANRFIDAPLTPEQLPPIDAVIISHNHADHVDEKSLAALKNQQPAMHVPLGNKQWFVARGFTNVTEMNWWDEVVLDHNSQQLKLTFLPASHWTSRGLFDINKSLWGSWMISSNQQNVYFAGDTAYDKHFKAIKKHFPSIDVALMPIGPNEPRELMHDSHMSSEESVEAFLDLDAQHFIPMHWGTFMFALDTFIEPIERLVSNWEHQKKLLVDKTLHVIKCGESKQFGIPQVSVVKPDQPQITE